MIPKQIALFTSARSEFGSMKPLLERLNTDPEFQPMLIVAGDHFVGDHTEAREASGKTLEVASRIPFPENDRSVEGLGASVGDLLRIGVREFSRLTPDLVILNGDRIELMAVATAATLTGVPIAHIAGGEITEGAFDDSVRHAVTKMSHLHFATNSDHATRIQQMGEEPWRVHITGEPALDVVTKLPLLSRGDLETSLNFKLIDPVIIVTFHPETRGGDPVQQLQCVIEAMKEVDATYVITAPNIDPGSQQVLDILQKFAEEADKALLIDSLGQLRYYSLMKISAAMLGNSSSGLWEAPSFGLPVVNVGRRQDGRTRAANVLDVPAVRSDEVRSALDHAVNPGFRRSLRKIRNPYGTGEACERIVSVLRKTKFGEPLLSKKFIDMQ